ncbi:MAG: 2'-5' RNA ligase family protein [Planctomycetes bacterium]|nr:2'-5' RNA ligase family protein [Planctomycetota bacterium]
MNEPLRLFVAAYPPPSAAAAMLARLPAAGLPPHRPTEAAQLHQTLYFLGGTRESDLPGVEESIERSCSGVASFRLTPKRMITLPERGLARLIAAETDAPPSLLEVHRRLVKRLLLPPRTPHRERFLPHFTLARFNGGGVQFRMDDVLDSEPIDVIQVVLVRSILKPGGAVHVPVRRFRLD